MRGGKADQPAAGVLFDLGPHVIDQALVLVLASRVDYGVGLFASARLLRWMIPSMFALEYSRTARRGGRASLRMRRGRIF